MMTEREGEVERGSIAAGLSLEDPVDAVRGIGAKRAAVLAAAGIETVEDLLLHLPFRYEDRSRIGKVAEAVAGETITLRVEVVDQKLVRRGRASRVEATVSDETGSLRVVWFRQPYRADQLREAERVWLHGKASTWEEEVQLVNPLLEPDEGADPVHVGGLVPVYRAIGPLRPRRLRRLLKAALDGLGEVPETLPPGVRERLSLVGRREAIEAVHRPPDDARDGPWNAFRSPAHRRLIFEELLAFQTALLGARVAGRGRGRAVGSTASGERALSALPFELTAGQHVAFATIIDEMGREAPMHRLLQGDVGSGKTAVAAAAMLVAALEGYQAVLMAPTEILAEQHAAVLERWAGELGLAVGCVTAGRPPEERRREAEALAAGDLRLAVGTHALIQGDLELPGLGLAVVDEQHRFGVRQRARLRQIGHRGGRWPDLLVMTATPIPRSLALTAYGDLDVSTIRDMPPGRRTVRTHVCSQRAWDKAIDLLARSVERGERAFVVAPRIEAEDGNGEPVRAATDLARELEEELGDARVGLLHGALEADAKLAAMRAFADGDVDVLVATTVVEVGVDVPEATLMVVQHAERFGLAQLHQLRGRVGRGDRPAVCLLVAHEPLSEPATRRLQALRDSDDGFELAELDLELRGPGEIFGTRQAGVPGLRVGDPIRDRQWMMEARDEAERLVRSEDAGDRAYRKSVRDLWERRFALTRAG